jgi:2-keto-3-deoxy-L-rhamnonate aldolase RhmA
VIEAALAAGIPPRIELNDAADAEPYLAMGVRHFCLGTDLVVLHEWWRRQGGELGERLAAAGW